MPATYASTSRTSCSPRGPAFRASWIWSARKDSVSGLDSTTRPLPTSENASSPGTSSAEIRPGPRSSSIRKPRSSAVTQPAPNSASARVRPKTCGTSQRSRRIRRPAPPVFSLRARRAPELAAWSASLLAYALACGALAWGAAAGWDARAFRAYYLFGGLLTAPLLGVGSLLLARRRWAAPVGLVYAGLAVGVAIAVPVSGAFASSGIPAAQHHLDLVPARALAVAANGLGTLAAVGVALLTIR